MLKPIIRNNFQILGDFCQDEREHRESFSGTFRKHSGENTRTSGTSSTSTTSRQQSKQRRVLLKLKKNKTKQNITKQNKFEL